MNEMLALLLSAFKADATDFLNTRSDYINRDQDSIDAITALINSTEIEDVQTLGYIRLVIFSEEWIGQLTVFCNDDTITPGNIQILQDQLRAMIPGFVMGLMYNVDTSTGI